MYYTALYIAPQELYDDGVAHLCIRKDPLAEVSMKLFGLLQCCGVVAGLHGNANSLNSAGQLTNITYVPEPSSLLGLLGISVLGGFTRFRRRLPS